MIKVINKWVGLLFLLLLCIFISCDVPDDDSGDDYEIKTIEWEQDGHGYTQFYTNDEKNIGLDEWHFNHIIDPEVTSMSSLEIEVKKESGHASAWFGIVFCGDKENFIWLSIDTQGNYIVKILENGKDVKLLINKSSVHLVIGYDCINTIKIRYIGDNECEIYFNGIDIGNNIENDLCSHFTNGDYGYIVHVSENENFPSIPVDVRFKTNIIE